MESENAKTEKYSGAIRVLHWVMAILIIMMLTMGLVMGNIPRGDPNRLWVYNLHKSLGVTILALAFIRLLIRAKTKAPALPDAIPAIERTLAKLGHLGLYAFMFALPITGLVMSNGFGFAVSWFGVELPRLVSPNRDLGGLAAEAHEILAYTLIALVAMHVLAVIKHYVRERINLLKRMI